MKTKTIQILIIYYSLLLKESVKKAINRHEELNVVAETTDLDLVLHAVENYKVDWILLITNADERLPAEIVQAMEVSNNIRLLIFAIDGSKVELYENLEEGKSLQIDSLEQLMELIKNPSIPIE